METETVPNPKEQSTQTFIRRQKKSSQKNGLLCGLGFCSVWLEREMVGTEQQNQL